MVIGSLQKEPDTTLRGALPTGGFTLHNYARSTAASTWSSRCSTPAIFTGGVLLGTVVFGVLAGYALARLHFRGRGTLFAVMLLVQIIPFQLLIIPIYVMIVRTYGLADSYLGMIVPFAINSTAVFVFRQFFLDAARRPVLRGRARRRERAADPVVDRAAAGAAGAADGDPADLHRPVERVPLAVPGDQGPEPATARGDAGQLHQQHRRTRRQPVRRDPRRGRGAGRAGRRPVRRVPEAVHRRRARAAE